ncbi:hypothetical protein [Pseudonocardia nigra]|uniref:hypothetical protein n=1 Tax=Pseudonocardia nigra TaxID=1921578 RepID=UPI001C5D41E2|nr:hypothetical protein [Pseudonocardia nigra]
MRPAVAAEIVSGIVRARRSAARRARANHAAYYRSIWTAAAGRVGVAVTDLGGGAIELALPALTLRVRGTHVRLDGPEVLRRAGDKAHVSELLAAAGLPVPPHRVVSPARLDEAAAFLAAAPDACVVKPARDTAAGRGVTTGVRTPRDLRRAAVAAAAAAARASALDGDPVRRAVRMAHGLDRMPLLIEHQIPGANYRLLFLDGVLIDAIRRDAPVAVGDGRRSVGELLDALNAARLRSGGGHAQVVVNRDLDLERTLADQGLTVGAVPAAGRAVRLKTTINDNAPDSNRPALGLLCADLVDQARAAAAAVGARLAGVDVITTNPGVSLAESGGCLLEVNTTPGLAMHYHGHDGGTDVATDILRQLAAQPRVETA